MKQLSSFFTLPDDNRGSALVTVLWLLTLLGAIVSAFALNAIVTMELSHSLSNLGVGQQLARSGVQAWSAQLRSQKLTSSGDSDVVVTEIMSYWPGSGSGGGRVQDFDANTNWSYTKHGDTSNISKQTELESNCPSSASTLMEFKNTDDQANGGWIKFPQSGSENFSDYDGGTITLDVARDDDNRSGSLVMEISKDGGSSWSTKASVAYTDPPSCGFKSVQFTFSNPGANFQFRIRGPNLGTYAEMGADNIKINLYGGPPPPDKNEYVEIFNASPDTVDVNSLGYQIEDNQPSNNAYDIVTHGLDGGGSSKLGPEKVGIVADTDVNLADLGIKNLVDGNKVQLYTTESSGNKQFLTDGLFHDTTVNNESPESITLIRPSDPNRTIPSGGSWTGGSAEEKVAMVKGDAWGTNDEDKNWTTKQNGSPGQAAGGAGGIDAFSDPWGYGGVLYNNSGIMIGEPVYLPSVQTNEPADGDVGYYEIVKIEDEAGKHDVKTPPSDGLFTTKYRDFVSSTKGDDASKFLTPGDLFPYISMTKKTFPEKWDDSKALFTVYRPQPSSPSPPDETDKININTAELEALMGIQIGSGVYLSEAQAKQIIKRRSPLTNVSISNKSDVRRVHNRDEPQSYMDSPGDADPFSSVQAACDHLSLTNSECSTMKDYAKTSSEGIFTVKVEGISMNDSGDTLGVVNYEAVVDVRPVGTPACKGDSPKYYEASQCGPMKVIYPRVR